MTTTQTKCILNHAALWENQVRSCDKPATHAWHRPGKTPIPCCLRGAKGLRDVRPI